MKEVGTYQTSFEDVIDTLSGMLERRDIVEKDIIGQPLIVEHTNKGGSTNLEQNPAIRLLNDMNRDILTYWRDLGLTPKGLKAINDAIQKESEDPLDKVLKELGR